MEDIELKELTEKILNISDDRIYFLFKKLLLEQNELMKKYIKVKEESFELKKPIQIGEYIIEKTIDEKTLWIEKNGDEGSGFDKKDLEPVICKFFEDNY